MCVIFVVNKTRPTDEMVERAFNHNKDGFGIAWREKQALADGGEQAEIVWKKGIENVEDAKLLCKNTPLPYVAHFRVASVGGVKKSLTHPFLVSDDVNLALDGRTTGSVLFHNGHWSPWAEKAMDAAISANQEIPEGDWSDTRAIAFMVNIYGPGFMELLPSQKGVIMTPKKLGVFTGNGFDQINGVWCSNDFFWSGRSKNSSASSNSGTTGNTGSTQRYPPYISGRLCSVGRCHTHAISGKEFCQEHDPATIKSELAEADGNVAEPTKQSNIINVDKPSALAVVMGGSGNRPLVSTLTQKEVEQLVAAGTISRNLGKKFRKEFEHLNRKDGKRRERAKETLLKLSASVGETLLHGSDR